MNNYFELKISINPEIEEIVSDICFSHESKKLTAYPNMPDKVFFPYQKEIFVKNYHNSTFYKTTINNIDSYDAVILDLIMPNKDGIGVLDYMKENNLFKKMPVSIISGDSSKETIDRAFTYPIVDMLSKPFNDRDIQRIIEKTILYKELKY